jgi:hypothetical protein
MQVSALDFIEKPALYLDKAENEPVIITKDDHIIAVLAKPGNTPVSDSLAGILKGAGIKSTCDIKALRCKEAMVQ